MVTAARLLLSSLVGLLAMVLATSVAAACSCAASTTAEHAKRADVVARGVIERIDVPDEAGRNAGDPALYTVRPSHAWKGDVVDPLTIATAPDGAACGLEFLPEGSDIVLFAVQEGEDLTANLCGGTAIATGDLRTEVSAVLGQGAPVDAAPSKDEPAVCTCEAKTTAEHAADADVVARVIVERVSIPKPGATPDQPATYTVRPTYVWKGDVVSQFRVTSEPDAAACGLIGITEGQDLVVFATESEEGFSATQCGGTAPASEELVSELLDVVGHGKAVDADPGDRPGAWVWPTISAVTAVAVVAGILYIWWIRPRRQP